MCSHIGMYTCIQYIRIWGPNSNFFESFSVEFFPFFVANTSLGAPVSKADFPAHVMMMHKERDSGFEKEYLVCVLAHMHTTHTMQCAHMHTTHTMQCALMHKLVYSGTCTMRTPWGPQKCPDFPGLPQYVIHMCMRISEHNQMSSLYRCPHFCVS